MIMHMHHEQNFQKWFYFYFYALMTNLNKWKINVLGNIPQQALIHEVKTLVFLNK